MATELLLNMGMKAKLIVVSGGSFGSLDAIDVILANLPPELSAALLVTVHLPRDTRISLAERYRRGGTLVAASASDGAAIEAGHVYFAVPDRHLAVADGRIRLLATPHVNRHRPSVDVLFRSAARAWGAATVGIVVSGTLDDGASGLASIEAHGGIALVQDPAEAMAPDMPRAALERTSRARSLRATELAATIFQLTCVTTPERHRSKGDAGMESHEDRHLSAGTAEAESSLDTDGRIEAFICPHCGGALKEELVNHGSSFVCHVGHSYSTGSLLSAHSEVVDDALWAAMRSLEEEAAIARRAFGNTQNEKLRRRLLERRDQAIERAAVIRRLLEQENRPPE